jgi:hypothetical protein
MRIGRGSWPADRGFVQFDLIPQPILGSEIEGRELAARQRLHCGKAPLELVAGLA